MLNQQLQSHKAAFLHSNGQVHIGIQQMEGCTFAVTAAVTSSAAAQALETVADSIMLVTMKDADTEAPQSVTAAATLTTAPSQHCLLLGNTCLRWRWPPLRTEISLRGTNSDHACWFSQLLVDFCKQVGFTADDFVATGRLCSYKALVNCPLC